MSTIPPLPQQGQPTPGQPVAGPHTPKKPWYLRWWSITIAGVLVLSCFGTLLGGGDESETASDTASGDGDSAAVDTGENTDADPAETEAEPVEESETDYFSSAFPVFDAVTESGSGDSVISLPAGQGIITAVHSGSSNFILTALDENNEMAELPVNTIGSYEGTSAYGLTGMGDDPASLEITAGGSWEITVAPVSQAPELGDPQKSQGDGVYRYTGGAATWQISHDGERNFIVTYVSDAAFGWDLVVNDIGSYEGTSAITSGPAVVTVNADGDWTIASS
ncbi:hypothetical protein L0U85_13630 [Glycomyces sp. L485]|uniref:hypothetical protein n=1 Tax=Glycomyces sp. L485 TaxID=2909235 RepID=UPI001F4B2B78|nr:hypothetical protein [Glycomyces sp. L485]MCH7231885.1 hypothetical protein [Glycomyces sp. L485]